MLGPLAAGNAREAERGASRVTVSYTDIEDGGSIKLRTKDPSLVRAISAIIRGSRWAHSAEPIRSVARAMFS